ncbi:AsmA-like C-terminal region-containing protein [Neorhizobium sp. NCHU2750]|uniref:AsmA family protein n=1 Tax=Neorhizobium sp. NCHU2750 TaxID=1825976 RepID=UPI000E7696DD|nr:AsmA protein [Neorhizobium sp. NCHU2750]
MFTKAAHTIRRHASRPYGRVLLIAAALVILAVAIFRIVTPFLISEKMIREHIEQSVEQWTGHEATIGGVSTIRFWPHPKVTLSDITIQRSGTEDQKVLAKIDSLSASFDLMEALLDRPVFKDFRLVHPRVYLDRDADGHLRWAQGGLLMDAMTKVTANGDHQTLPAGLDAPVGEMQVINGVIEIAAGPGEAALRIDAIDGRMGWPHLSAPASGRMEAMLRGKKIELDLRSTQPLLLLDGRSGEFQGRANSDFGQATFDGIASLTRRGYFSGDAELQASDMPALMRWAGFNPALVDGLQSASFSAKLIADRQELRFENLSLGLNDEHATGLMEVDIPDAGRSKLSGTLAFDRIDLLRLLAALEPTIMKEPHALPSLMTDLELDLRLSSQIATLGAVQIHDIALGLMNVSDQFRLDILDSDLQPGRLTGRISTIKETKGVEPAGSEASGKDDKRRAVAFRASIRGADFAALAQQLQLAGPIPQAQGSLDIALDVPQPINEGAWNAATGSLSFQAGPGRLTGVDMAVIRQLAGQKPYFPLGAAATGAVDFDSINASAVIRDGIANFDKAEIAGRNETISMKGAVPLATRSLALSASVLSKDGGAPLGFFIGGAWPSPILWPTAAPQQKASE